MKIWTSKKIEDCFANRKTFAYLFPFSVTEEGLMKYGDRGELRIKKNFRRPCYFLDLHGGIRIKGILGESQMKVSFPEEEWNVSQQQFEKELEDILDMEAM